MANLLLDDQTGMEASPDAANIHVLDNCHTGQGSISCNSSMILTQVHDPEIGLLPDINVPGTQSVVAKTVKSSSPMSTFSYPAKPDFVLKTSEGSKGKLIESFADFREQSPNGDSSLLPNDASDCQAAVMDKSCVAKANMKLLENQSALNFHDKEGRSSSQTQLQKLGTQLLPGKFRPYRKSLSQREFSVEEKQNFLPDISPKEKTISSGTTSGGGTSGGISRSSSFRTIALPSIPPRLIRFKSLSQPDILSAVSPMPENCISQLTRKLKIRNLWKGAVEKLNLSRQSGDEGAGENELWMMGPGNMLRPIYARWSQRRNALAEPERMCMPQVLREQIQKDVQSRRRSMKRRMSKFLNVNLGLNLEEDLSA